MFVQTEITPNPNALKFLPGKIVSNCGSFEITKKEETNMYRIDSRISALVGIRKLCPRRNRKCEKN